MYNGDNLLLNCTVDISVGRSTHFPILLHILYIPPAFFDGMGRMELGPFPNCATAKYELKKEFS